MKSLILSLLILLSFSMTASAQQTVASIRKAYQEMNEHIVRMMDDESYVPKEFYNLHVMQNLPGTGPHDVNIMMYYDEKPGQAEDEIYPEHCLQFATKKYNYAARQYYEEYLFDAKGQLLFAYSRYVGDEVDNIYELRLWFNGRRLLQVMAKENTAEDWEHPVFRDVSTGTAIPEKFQSKSVELKGSAQHLLRMFDSIKGNPF